MILLIEDNEDLCQLTMDFLMQHGYSVLRALDGQSAIHLFLKYQHQIRLILVDVQLPDISGPELVMEIQKQKKDIEIQVLYLSGYEISELQLPYFDQNSFLFLQKPYRPRELLEKIKSILI